MKKFISKSTQSYLRSMLFSPFIEDNKVINPKGPGLECCSFCAKNWSCQDNFSPPTLPIFEIEQMNTENKVVIRSVSPEEENIVRELLLEYHEEKSKSTTANSIGNHNWCHRGSDCKSNRKFTIYLFTLIHSRGNEYLKPKIT